MYVFFLDCMSWVSWIVVVIQDECCELIVWQ